MIPLKLELKNFLSYGDIIQTIDFSNHNLLCLSGKNGNGKSALLDAITWAVWGQARKVGGISKADDGLLRLGQTRMMVALTLTLNNKTYRVRREYGKTYGKPQASLDFELFDEEGGFFRSLTDKTIRATQEVIERTINLDYETFINSAFLRQGQSNEFSKKTAKERKQILAGILGLGSYDTLQQHATATAKKIELQVATLHQVLLHLETEINQEPLLQSALEVLLKELETNNKELSDTQKILFTQERLLQQHEEQKKLKTFLENEQLVLSQRFFATARQFHETRRSWQDLHILLRNQPTPQELEARRVAVFAQKKEQAMLTESITQLERQHTIYIQQLQTKHFCLEQEHTRACQAATLVLEKASSRLHQQTSDHTRLTAELHDTEEKVKLINKALRDGDVILQQEASFNTTAATTKQQFEKRRIFYQQMVQLGNQDMAQLKELEQKKLLLTADETANCPLCSQSLSQVAHHQVIADLQTREGFTRNRIKRVTNVLKNLKELLVTQHEACATLEKQALAYAQLHTALTEKRTQYKDLRAKQTTLTQAVVSLEQIIKIQTQELANATTALVTLEQKKAQLAKHPELATLSTVLAQYEAAIGECTKKLASYVAADTMLNELETLQQASTNRSSFEHKLATLGEKSYELLTVLRDLKKQEKSFATNLSTLQTVDTHELTITLQAQYTKKEFLEQQKSTFTQEQGRIISSLERINTIKHEVTQKRSMIVDLQAEMGDYESLAFAFGKNGIQALLIEEAIPEIEQEANSLLAKLTDNQAQIFIESLRDLKSGGVKETLEIKVADAAGIRPYEMFSGGEAFRVDFALRIAISKLLTRRAGTALQTLIIDEGFGSQDEEGLARIMSSLYAIQNDFSKIIIVSHLNEFKENFPVHFVVEKSSAGSTVRIEERG
jgi:exonuclease SbcC